MIKHGLDTNNNSKKTLLAWAIHTLADSSLDRILILELMIVANYSINRRGWREDISCNWMKHSPLVTIDTVPDLILKGRDVCTPE